MSQDKERKTLLTLNTKGDAAEEDTGITEKTSMEKEAEEDAVEEILVNKTSNKVRK